MACLRNERYYTSMMKGSNKRFYLSCSERFAYIIPIAVMQLIAYGACLQLAVIAA